jgi:hypothetical protein
MAPKRRWVRTREVAPAAQFAAARDEVRGSFVALGYVFDPPGRATIWGAPRYEIM